MAARVVLAKGSASSGNAAQFRATNRAEVSGRGRGGRVATDLAATAGLGAFLMWGVTLGIMAMRFAAPVLGPGALFGLMPYLIGALSLVLSIFSLTMLIKRMVRTGKFDFLTIVPAVLGTASLCVALPFLGLGGTLAVIQPWMSMVLGGLLALRQGTTCLSGNASTSQKILAGLGLVASAGMAGYGAWQIWGDPAQMHTRYAEPTGYPSSSAPEYKSILPEVIWRDVNRDGTLDKIELFYRMNSDYGERIDPFTGRRAFHRGVDIVLDGARVTDGRTGDFIGDGRIESDKGEVTDNMVSRDWLDQNHVYIKGLPINSPVPATVVDTSRSGRGYGNSTILDLQDKPGDPNYGIRIGHQSKIGVSEGDEVYDVTPVGAVGGTGRAEAPHVHLELLEGIDKNGDGRVDEWRPVDPRNNRAFWAMLMRLTSRNRDVPMV